MVIAAELEPNSETPLYRQLFEKIKAGIVSGRLARGERLPATRELAGSLGLNRATVSAAYELLEAEGLIKGHVGRGSFVDGPAPEAAGLNWHELLRGAGDVPEPLPAVGEDGVSFASSRPAQQLFPLEEFRATCAEVIDGDEAAGILQLGSPGGYPPLRRYLLKEAQAHGIAGSEDDLTVTSGAQQALDLLQRVLVAPGDTVLIEDPVYPGLRNVFSRAGARLVGVPVGVDGIELTALERAIQRERPRLLVVTPNFQNPTGATLPLAVRTGIIRMAREAGCILVENDAYGELRYVGEPLPSLKELDESGDVILLKSFSKLSFPGLRVGWVIGPRPLVGRLAEAKQWCDLHTDQLSQAVLLRFAESGRLAGHRERVVEAGAERLAAVLEGCARELPQGTEYTRPQGGMNLWVRLPAPLDASDLLPRAVREKVSYLPGRYFGVSRFESGSLRLSFAGLTPEKIRTGLATLGQLFSEELRRSRTAAREMDPAPALV
jgi:2-aminoadipate transaminase